MELTQILSFIGTLGLGGLIGILLKSYFDHKLNKNKILFETRVKAYSKVIGRIFNLFQEIDIHAVTDEVKFTKLNHYLSEVMLMAGHELAEHIGNFKVKVFQFHLVLEKDVEKSKILIENIRKFIYEYYDADNTLKNKFFI